MNIIPDVSVTNLDHSNMLHESSVDGEDTIMIQSVRRLNLSNRGKNLSDNDGFIDQTGFHTRLLQQASSR